MKYFLPFLLLFSFAINAQSKFAHYTTSDGLPNNLCYSLVQDQDGYLWIGTDDGLAKFNGRIFKNYRSNSGLKSNYAIVPIEVNNELIISTWGKGLYYKSNEQFLSLVSNDSVSKINNLTYGNSKLWSVTASRNFVFEPLSDTSFIKTPFSSVLIDKKPKFIREGKKNNITLSFQNVNNKLYITSGFQKNKEKLKGIFEVKSMDSIVEVFTFLNSENYNGITNRANEYIINSAKQIFVANQYEIIETVTPKTKFNSLEKVFPYNDGYLVLIRNLDNQRVLKLINNQGDLLSDFNKLLNIDSNISDVLVDNENNIWISSYGQGLFCVFSNENFNYSEILGTENKLIKDILSLDNTTYLLTDSELLVSEENNAKTIFRLKNYPSNLSKKNDSLYVQTIDMPEGLSFSGNKIKERQATIVVNDNQVGEIIIKQDSLIVPNLDIKLKDKRFLYLSIHDATFFKDQIYIATNDGLLHFGNNSAYLENTNQINDILKDKDTLWLATNNGIVKYFDDESVYYRTSNELLTNDINALLKDKEDILWVGSNKGISIIRNDIIQNLYLKNAVHSSYVTSLSLSSINHVWVGTNNGAFSIDNNKSIPQESAPVLVIDRNSEYNFLLDVITYNRSKAYQLEYRINDDAWIATKTLNFDFSNYTQGDYQVMFRAKKQDGIWGYSNVYDFQLRLPWYKQNHFYVIVFILTLLIIALLFYHRLKLIKKRNKILSDVIEKKDKLEGELSVVRENLAKDFHDNLGNKLARISMVSNYMLESKSKSIDENTSEALIKIKSDADDLYQGTKDFMFSLKTDSDYISEVLNYLGDFAFEFLESYNIDFNLIDLIEEDLKLPHYWNRQIILIFKEALTNIAKHSQCKKATLKVKTTKHKFEITCEDDGMGFDFQNVNLRGLNNMKKRAKDMSAEFQIKSTIHKGTIIQLKGSFLK